MSEVRKRGVSCESKGTCTDAAKTRAETCSGKLRSLAALYLLRHLANHTAIHQGLPRLHQTDLAHRLATGCQDVREGLDEEGGDGEREE